MNYEHKWALVNELNKGEDSSSGDKMRIGQFAEKRKNYDGYFLGMWLSAMQVQYETNA